MRSVAILPHTAEMIAGCATMGGWNGAEPDYVPDEPVDSLREFLERIVAEAGLVPNASNHRVISEAIGREAGASLTAVGAGQTGQGSRTPC